MAMLDHKFEPNSSAARRVEVFVGTGRRRRWSLDERIAVDIKRSAILMTTKEKAVGAKTHVFRFANFTGHDPREDIRVDEQSRYLD